MKKPAKPKGRRRVTPAPQEAPPVEPQPIQRSAVKDIANIILSSHIASGDYPTEDDWKAAHTFRVEQVENSMVYYVGQMLAVADVEGLVADPTWNVVIKAP